VDRAISSFTININADVLRAVSTFAEIDLSTLVTLSGNLEYYHQKSTDPVLGQQQMDQIILNWFNTVWIPSWTGLYLRTLVDLEANYMTWFGNLNPSGTRVQLKNFVQTCDATCIPSSTNAASLFGNGNVVLGQCQEKTTNAKTNLNQLRQYAAAYTYAANKIFQLGASAVAVMQYSSNCNVSTLAEVTSPAFQSKCYYAQSMVDITSKILVPQGRASALRTAMETLKQGCDPTSLNWPFSQVSNFALVLLSAYQELHFKVSAH